MRCPAQGATGGWAMLGLVFKWFPLWVLTIWYFLGLVLWSQCSHSKGSELDLWSGMKIPQVVCYGIAAAAAAAKSLQSCPTLWDPIDGSPPGSPVPGILQATIMEWVAIFFSNAWKWKVKVKSLSRVWPSETPWTSAFQAPLSKSKVQTIEQK